MNPLKAFLDAFPNKTTARTYLYHIKKLFQLVYEEGDLYELSERYVKEREDNIRLVENDLNRLYMLLQDYAPITQSMVLSVVRQFLQENRIAPDTLFWARFTRRGRKIRTIHQDTIPKSEDIRRILSHMNINGQAVFTMMASTGARIGETMLIRMEDLHLEETPPRAYIKAERTKSKEDRVIFFTQEAKESLSEWLKVRDAFLVRRETYHLYKELKDDLLFPFSTNNARYMWNLALKKVGFDKRDERTNRFKMRPHTLRKRFRTQLGAVIPVDVIEVLMGHSAYMDSYRRYTEAELEEFYLEGQHVLTLSSDRAEVERLKRTFETEQKERDIEMDEIKRELAHLKVKISRDRLDE